MTGGNHIDTSKLLFFGALLTFFLLFVAIEGPTNWLAFALHCSIIVLSLLHIAIAPKFNLGLSFSFFALFFFGAIPLLEHKLNIAYYGANLPSESSYQAAAGLALLSSIFFYIGYSLKKAIPPHRVALSRVQYVNRLHNQLVYAVAAVGVVALSIYVASYYQFDFDNIFFRGFGESVDSSVLGFSFVNFFVRPLLFNLVFLIILTKHRSGQKILPYAFCLVIAMFVSPLGIARALVGALYIPLLVMFVFPRLNFKYSVLCIIIFAIVVAAPVVDIFRLIHFDEISLFQNYRVDYFFAGHFDAFQVLAQVIELDFSSKGTQLIGALLFWIPRATWPDKPIGTSFEFADYAGFTSGNISFPLTAELFVDFGVVGVILGMFMLGIVCKNLDIYLSRPRRPGSYSSYICAIGHLEVAILGIYLLRGNVLSTFAYTVGLSSTLIVLSVVTAAIRSISLEVGYMLKPIEK